MNKNLIYFCAFFDERILDLLDTLLKSIKKLGNINENIDTPTNFIKFLLIKLCF